jgi:hypothetical protein
MASTDFDRLIEAFSSEIKLWPPSEQSFDASLVKAKSFAGLSEIRLLPHQREHLFGMYQIARELEWKSKPE